jgi:excisionase family DNA binding protein
MLSDDLLNGASAAAGYVGVTQRTIYRMADSGHIPVIRKGRKLYFRKSDLDKAFTAEAA